MNVNYLAFLPGGIILILWVYVELFPQKKINHLYGYRTFLSMRNQDTQDEGNRVSMEKMLNVAMGLLLIGLVGQVLPEGFEELLPTVALLPGLYWIIRSPKQG